MPTDTAEIYDPNRLSWIAAASMATARMIPAMTELANGSLLVTGGADVDFQRSTRCEVRTRADPGRRLSLEVEQ